MHGIGPVHGLSSYQLFNSRVALLKENDKFNNDKIVVKGKIDLEAKRMIAFPPLMRDINETIKKKEFVNGKLYGNCDIGCSYIVPFLMRASDWDKEPNCTIVFIFNNRKCELWLQALKALTAPARLYCDQGLTEILFLVILFIFLILSKSLKTFVFLDHFLDFLICKNIAEESSFTLISKLINTLQTKW